MIAERLVALHGLVFGSIQRALDGWFIGLSARLAFAAVLLVYFWNSAATKIEPGVFGFLSMRDGAYAQVLPKVLEAADYDVSAIGFPYHVIVYLGTYAEFILPLLIVIGLFTRLSALGMIGFTVVMSVVDITGHGANAATIGAWFDRFENARILDLRTMWVFLFVVLVVYGPGKLSLDHLLGRFVRDRADDSSHRIMARAA